MVWGLEGEWAKVRVTLDIPIFTGAAAWGSARGEVEVPTLPADYTHLELPFYDEEFASAGFDRRMLAWGTSYYADGGHGILMDGVVVATEFDAERIANLLTYRLGFFAIKYGDDDWEPSGVSPPGIPKVR